MDNELKAKRFYRMLDPNLTCQSTDEVGSVLNRVDNVHGGLIVFNEDNDFIGVLSSFKTIYKSHSTPSKKVANSVIQPMLITKDTPLNEIANYMAAEKVYLLPVFENENVIGTISATDIVKRMLHDQNLLLAAAEELNIDKPMTIRKDATVKEAFALLRSNGTSELIVVDDLGKVAGSISRSDIKHAFIHPTDKQRFHHDNFRPDDLSFDAEKKRRQDDPIRNYLTELVPTIYNDASNEELILALLNNNEEYLIITDKGSIPVGIISYRNLLEAIAKIGQAENEINIIFEKPSDNVSEQEFKDAYEDLTQYLAKINKRIAIERAEVHVQEPKYTTNKTAQFDLKLQIDPYSGGQYIAYTKTKDFGQSLRAAMKQIQKQLQRDEVNRKKHHKKSLGEASREAIDRGLYR